MDCEVCHRQITTRNRDQGGSVQLQDVVGDKKPCATHYHPQSSSVSEHMHSTLYNMLAAQDKWAEIWPFKHSQNTMQYDDNETPFFLMVGRQARLPVLDSQSTCNTAQSRRESCLHPRYSTKDNKCKRSNRTISPTEQTSGYIFGKDHMSYVSNNQSASKGFSTPPNSNNTVHEKKHRRQNSTF